MGHIELTDSVVYDDDWQAYVFFGDWQWDEGHPSEWDLEPWDCVGMYIRDRGVLDPEAFFLYGYNKRGRRTVYYNTEDRRREGPVQKGDESRTGVAFWLDESVVDHGTLVAILDVDDWNDRTKVFLEYAHSWTEQNVTGVGGSVGVESFGLDISWDKGVEYWPDHATSYGVRVPPRR